MHLSKCSILLKIISTNFTPSSKIIPLPCDKLKKKPKILFSSPSTIQFKKKMHFISFQENTAF